MDPWPMVLNEALREGYSPMWWLTSTSQWGNAIALHAAYMHPMLRSYVPAHGLIELTERVREFAHPSSALADDIRILDHAAGCSGA
ncbi:hypothetical protein VE03_10543, partial [Pseudogymnoascus sp. 23342-1-I1]